ncbi:hypothetical protein N7471_009147 [Penicillium samsonianum]|uniref:uncharacterized protein n=1 Tax=Penicillium samsonianum TaxID=1882272 RepID=UPI0025480EEC|nr:uncharacterized protein N7471_009147 [Penicillium samsonianum]KAJ6127930.1 hypothetical protein N7471_009147 [Penicillium samsonianum]
MVGRQSGSVKPGEAPAIKEGTTSFRHDASTLAEIWDSAGVQRATRWEVECSLDEVGVQPRIKNAVEDEKSRRLFPTIPEEG